QRLYAPSAYTLSVHDALPIYSTRLAEDAGKVIRANNGKPRATDGPYSEAKEVLGGFYLIEAASYDEAVELSMTHPHLEYGGTIRSEEHTSELQSPDQLRCRLL